MSYGVDLARDVAPVCPAAHYMMGGVKTDLWGRTSLPGLYAAGEQRTPEFTERIAWPAILFSRAWSSAHAAAKR